MKTRYLTEPLPPFETPERRAVRLALIDYRDRMKAQIEKLVIVEGFDPDHPRCLAIDAYIRVVTHKLYHSRQ